MHTVVADTGVVTALPEAAHAVETHVEAPVETPAAPAVQVAEPVVAPAPVEAAPVQAAPAVAEPAAPIVAEPAAAVETAPVDVAPVIAQAPAEPVAAETPAAREDRVKAPAPAVAEPAAQPQAAEPVVQTVAEPVTQAAARPAATSPSDEALAPMLASAGLVWVNTDADKLRVAQAAAALVVKPARAPRERKPLPPVDTTPMQQVETNHQAQ